MAFSVFTEQELEAFYFLARGNPGEIWKWARTQIVAEIRSRNAMQGISKD